MTMSENLKNILLQQQEITKGLQKEISQIESNDLVTENDFLKAELEKYKRQLNDTKANNSRLEDENKNLKNSLYEQLYNEKIAILNAVNKKVDAYYQANTLGELNRLKLFEIGSQNRINWMISVLRQNRVNSEDEIYTRIDELNYLLRQKVTEARVAFEEQAGAYSQNKNAEFERMRQEGLQENEINSALKKNNIESLVGLNISNKIGILFIIIGVIAGMQFTYLWLSDAVKGILAFLVGTLLLVSGEILNRRKANIFSLGITSGGVAVLYAAVAFSYFGLNILNMYFALGICIAITILAFTLSQRYDSQTIATFSIVGGYLPIFAVSQNKGLVYSAMVYFIILNIFALVISFRKKWSITSAVGLGLNIVGSIYIMRITLFDTNIHSANLRVSDVIGIIYIIFTFAIYTLIPIVSAYSSKIKLKSIDVILLGINTYFSAILLYIAFYRVNLDNFTGLLAVIFAATYIALGRFVEKKLVQEKNMEKLFYLTGLTFVVLIIPFQFDKVWVSLGWLIEGVALVTYGALKDKKNFSFYGYIINGLCLTAFILVDIASAMFARNDLFVYQYLSITLGSIIIMYSYLYKKRLFGQGVLALKYCTSINIWFFMLYIIGIKFSKTLNTILRDSNFNEGYIIAALCISLGFVIAYILPRIKGLSDLGMKIISISISSISILWLFILNSTSSPTKGVEVPIAITIVATIILIIISIMSVLSMMDLVKGLVLTKELGVECYPLIVSIYFVLILTQNLIAQYHLEFSSFAISIIYVVIAFSWIVFGFIKRYSFIRRFGLGLSLMAIAKLFILDLSFLTEGYRIISYFVFGIALIAISFVYQYFNKRIDGV